MIENYLRTLISRFIKPRNYTQYIAQSSHAGVHNFEGNLSEVADKKKLLQSGPNLEHFIANPTRHDRKVLDANPRSKFETVPYLRETDILGHGRKGTSVLTTLLTVITYIHENT